jgi:predicted RNA-binding protein (virulence factor B family)
VAVNKVGAFLDWGLPKDLLCPYGEQHQTMEEGKSYLVIVFLDDDNRIAASARINEFLEDENAGKFSAGQSVSLIIADKTPLGIKAVIDNSHWGVLYENELFNKVRKGQKLTGYIKKIRDDGRIDLALQKPGAKREQVVSLADSIMQQITLHKGFLPMNDKTPPEEIYAMFGVSKKTFKQAIGGLYKQRRIVIEESGIRLVR